MNMYRAEYRTRDGTRRSGSRPLPLADRLVAVVAVRAMQRPVFQLQAQ